MTAAPRSFLSPVHDELIGALVVACLVAPSGLAPRRNGMTSAGGLAFTAAMGMVYRVHGNAPVNRLLSQPAIAAGLADRDVLMLYVADLADGGHAINQYFTGLAGRQFDQGIFAFFGNQLRCASRRAHHLGALTVLQ